MVHWRLTKKIYIYSTCALFRHPYPGNTISSLNPACSGLNFTLSLQNVTPGAGVTYQWQSSTTGNDPWTNSCTAATQVTSQIVATHYRCQVTRSENTGTSIHFRLQ